MENTYCEPQTPLFPPSYVNLVNKKDPIAESEHNTDCDVTLGITNSYAPIILHIPAHVLGQPPAEPSEVLIK